MWLGECSGKVSTGRGGAGLMLLGRKVAFLANPERWPLEERGSCTCWAPKPKGDFTQLNCTCPLGRALRPKALKMDFHQNRVLGNYHGLSLICYPSSINNSLPLY